MCRATNSSTAAFTSPAWRLYKSNTRPAGSATQVAQHPEHLRVPLHELSRVLQLPNLVGPLQVCRTHNLVFILRTRLGEDVYLVLAHGVKPLCFRGNHPESPVNALRTHPAMGVGVVRLPRVRTAPGIRDHRPTLRLVDLLHHVALGGPNEWVLHHKRLIRHHREQLLEAVQ